MFRRMLSVLLCASMLAGSVTNTAYAAPGNVSQIAAIETEADENQDPEETNEADLQETPETEGSTDESQITDAADENSDVSDVYEETGDRNEVLPADSGDVSDEADITESDDAMESTDTEESADTEVESEEVDEEVSKKEIAAVSYAVAPMSEDDKTAAEKTENELTLNTSKSVTIGGGYRG